MGLTPGGGRGFRRGGEGTVSVGSRLDSVKLRVVSLVLIRIFLRLDARSGQWASPASPGCEKGAAALGVRGKSFYGCFLGSPDIGTF